VVSTEALAVNLLLLLGLALFVLDAPVERFWARLCATALMAGLTLGYLAWRWQETMPELRLTPCSLWPWLFFAMELVVLVYELWSLFVLVRLSDHSAQADIHERGLREAAELPTVDVFIPSYGEGAPILDATIRGALALDYPAGLVRVWVLDDSRRSWLHDLCAEHGVGYFARPTNEHGKAGNLNYALPRTTGQYILVIDADFVLEPHFLLRTLGFLLEQPEVALVQTPQHFRNPDPVQYNLFGAAAWTEEQHFFMTIVQSARDSRGNAFCVGSGWVVRRACLDELGGFPQGSICEDLEITYALLARGKRTLYLNEPLAVGLAPESVPEYLKQRVRWCSGTMQHAFLATGPFRGRLSLLQRAFYLETIVYWLTFPFTVLLIIAPIVYWFTGLAAIAGAGDTVLLVIIPRFLASYILIYWLSHGKVMPPITMVHRCLSAFHLTAALAKALVQPFGTPFKVTAKGQDRDKVVVQWSILWIFLTLGLTLLLGVAMNLSGFYEVVPLSDLTAVDVAWSGLTLLLLSLCGMACVEQPKRAGYLDARCEVRRASLTGTAAAILKRLFA
jgi:cellulose synthase (UDP-forming)